MPDRIDHPSLNSSDDQMNWLLFEWRLWYFNGFRKHREEVDKWNSFIIVFSEVKELHSQCNIRRDCIGSVPPTFWKTGLSLQSFYFTTEDTDSLAVMVLVESVWVASPACRQSWFSIRSFVGKEVATVHEKSPAWCNDFDSGKTGSSLPSTPEWRTGKGRAAKMSNRISQYFPWPLQEPTPFSSERVVVLQCTLAGSPARKNSFPESSSINPLFRSC